MSQFDFLTQSMPEAIPDLGVLLGTTESSNIFLRVIFQVLVWNIPPFALAALLPAKFNDVQDELSVNLRWHESNRTKAGEYLSGMLLAMGAFLAGLMYVYFARVVNFTPNEWAEANAWVLILLAFGACVSIAGVTYAGWYTGTRFVWTTQRRPTIRTPKSRSPEPDDDASESERLDDDVE